MKRSLLYTLVIFVLSCQQNKTSSGSVKNGDIKISYTVDGNSDTAIVFVHGWGINKEYWDKQRADFSNNFTVITYDLGGHGESGKNRKTWTINDFADDGLAVIRAVNPQKVILVGHSMGGNIILNIADKIQDKLIGFVGIDNFKDQVTEFTPEQRAGIDTFMHELSAHYDTVVASYTYGNLFPHNYTDSASMKRVVKDIGKTDTAVTIGALRSLMNETLHEFDGMAKLEVPVHLIVSDYTLTNEEPLKKNSKKGYSIKTIKGTGHYPMIEKPEEFNTVLWQVIDDIRHSH